MGRFSIRRGGAAVAWMVMLLAAASGTVAAADGQGNIIVGTTDSITTLDPAKCYNYWCSSVVFENAGETLVGYTAGSASISPELAAELPEISDDGLTYTFRLRQGVTFHDGSRMTSEDVKFSLNRARWIAHPEGAGFLLNGIERIETPDPYTVVIHLKAPDITFSSKLAYQVAVILPSDAYPSPDGPLPADASPAEREKFIQEEFIGTGPYRITDFRENQSMLMEAYDGYWGEQPRNDKVLTRFFAKSSQMVVALRSGEIDVAYRHLTPAQRKSLEGSDDIRIVEGEGAAIRYLVFNPRLEPSDELAVRKAIAAAVDRDRIIDSVLGGAAEPLYSMIPPAFDSYRPAFRTLYQDRGPDDFVDGNVDLTLWYSRGHYGDTEPALAQTLARTLEETGVFDVTLQSSEWAQFVASAWPGDTGSYPVFLLGWYPDYLDPDDYLSPFYDSEDSFIRMYDSAEMDRLLQREQTAQSPVSEQRMQTLEQIQTLAAKEVPTLPLYVVTPFAYVRSDVSGVQETMGPAQLFRFSLIHKSGG